MTAYELRSHLRDRHDLQMRGSSYGTLLVVHDGEHQHAQDHDHEDDTDAS